MAPAQTNDQKQAERDRIVWLLELELYGTIEPHERAELAVLRHRCSRNKD